ncbi:MAG: hypothetical protein LBL00_03460 [Endomicrobium sp.]|nr:hypothetical protein [Endomicrobium sp.]
MKTLLHFLMTGAAAEIIMFGSLFFRHMLTRANVVNGYLYVITVMFFYLSVLRTFKSYNAALAVSLIAAVVPAFTFIYLPGASACLASALFCCFSFFIYTFTDAKGLKHNQDKHFTALSLLLYAAALYFSPYAAALPCFICIYAIINKKTIALKMLKKKILFFILLALTATVIRLCGF